MSPEPIFVKFNLSESVIDGAELMHKTIEAHNCLQLRRWLKFHVGGNKKDLVEGLECLFLSITSK